MTRLMCCIFFASLLTMLGACTERVQPHAIILERQTIAERLVDSLMSDFHFTRSQAAGIVGNLAQESGQFHTLQEVGGDCYGYSQWCGVRKREFNDFARDNGRPGSFSANYGFLRYEMRRDYPDMIEDIRNVGSVETSAEIFMKVFLRPNARLANLPRRIVYARSYDAGNFQGSASSLVVR
ncbi:phage tail tip lysozyme [Pseudosulfitobacter pseudonitzschiae]|uniref:phage tail tip lysozyme n=1 Tax=Pseudosulfitobacter pseudonitzschiae TaxID=1402135 RepID=UPI003B7CF9A2